MLSKNAILACDDRNVKTVSVPEWGGDVGIRVLSGLERDLFEALFTEKKTDLFKVKFVACSLCDDKGDRLFTDAEVKALAEKSGKVINRLFDECWLHSSVSEEALDEAGKE